jgi:hypothetical protein
MCNRMVHFITRSRQDAKSDSILFQYINLEFEFKMYSKM